MNENLLGEMSPLNTRCYCSLDAIWGFEILAFRLFSLRLFLFCGPCMSLHQCPDCQSDMLWKRSPGSYDFRKV
jgi:hypothetical protein